MQPGTFDPYQASAISTFQEICRRWHLEIDSMRWELIYQILCRSWHLGRILIRAWDILEFATEPGDPDVWLQLQSKFETCQAAPEAPGFNIWESIQSKLGWCVLSAWPFDLDIWRLIWSKTGGSWFSRCSWTLDIGKGFRSSYRGCPLAKPTEGINIWGELGRMFEGQSLAGWSSVFNLWNRFWNLKGQLPKGLRSLILGENFPNFTGKQIPQQLQKLSLGSELVQSLKAEHHISWPTTLSTVTFGDEVNHQLRGATFLESVRNINFGLQFKQRLESVTDSSLCLICQKIFAALHLEITSIKAWIMWIYPRNLEVLAFGKHFNQELDYVRLPDGLLTIHFGSFFNCSLSRVRFPDGLATLIFGLFYNKTLEDVWLPASLKTSTFGRDFNQPMDWVYFPENLTAWTLKPWLQPILGQWIFAKSFGDVDIGLGV